MQNQKIRKRYREAWDAYQFEDKQKSVSDNISYMLDRTQKMFKWENLPETIPSRILELMLQTNGYVWWHKHEDNIYVFFGNLYDRPKSVYYEPTRIIISNVALNLYADFDIEKDGVLMNNDATRTGLLPLFRKYSTLLAENELTMYLADIMSRAQAVLTVNTDSEKESAQLYLNGLREGKVGTITNNLIADGVKTQPYASTASNMLTNLIEFQQYLKASWYNELGINANYNMKRESLNSEESQLNFDALLPLLDSMLEERQKACEKINEMFGLNVSVDFDSAWKDIREEIEKVEENEEEDLNYEEDDQNDTTSE